MHKPLVATKAMILVVGMLAWGGYAGLAAACGLMMDGRETLGPGDAVPELVSFIGVKIRKGGGALTEAEAGAVAGANVAAIRECYDAMLERTATGGGLVMANITIAKDGKAKVDDVQNKVAKDAAFDTCVKQRVSALKFPRPRGGAAVSASLVYQLEAAGSLEPPESLHDLIVNSKKS